MVLCEHCGYNAAPEARYCIMCGTRLNMHSKTSSGFLGSIKHHLHRDMAGDELDA
jgi:hypothetical protein